MGKDMSTHALMNGAITLKRNDDKTFDILIGKAIIDSSQQKLEEALMMACNSLDASHNQHIQFNTYTSYDPLNKTLIIDKNIIKLTQNELLFFDFLVKNKQRAITYEEIENIIWAYEGMSMDALRSLVRGLRKKLGGDFIENVSGVGYRLTTY